MASPWTGIIEDARHYPSPHNSQPIVVRVEDDRTATVFYDLRRGLPAESFGIPFGHVCAGVFLAGLDVVARAHGFTVQERLDHAEMDFGRLDAGADDHLHRLGTVTLRPHVVTDGRPGGPGRLPRTAHLAQALRRNARRRHRDRGRVRHRIGGRTTLPDHRRPGDRRRDRARQPGDPVRRPAARRRARRDPALAAVLEATGSGHRRRAVRRDDAHARPGAPVRHGAPRTLAGPGHRRGLPQGVPVHHAGRPAARLARGTVRAPRPTTSRPVGSSCGSGSSSPHAASRCTPSGP